MISKEEINKAKFPSSTPDEFIKVTDWNDILNQEIQQELIKRNAIVIPHGSFVDRVVLTLISKRKLNAKKHTRKFENGVYLNKSSNGKLISKEIMHFLKFIKH